MLSSTPWKMEDFEAPPPRNAAIKVTWGMTHWLVAGSVVFVDVFKEN